MDEEYIKMCREAVEIQEAWKPKHADKILLESGFTDYVDEWCDKEQFTWLPRQEDLQEIIFNISKKGSIGILEEFIRWYQKGLPLFFDINKLWLCFVMETCYSKRWNGETWKKTD